MRICYIADGRYIHSHKWIRYFSARGHQAHFISFQPVENDHVEAIKEAGGIYHGDLGPFHIKRFWRTARDLRWLWTLLRRERIEVLHCHFLGVNTWYAALSGFQPFVITVMGGDVTGPNWQPRGVRVRLLTKLALRRASLITCWSDQLVGIVRPFCLPCTPVEVVHGGVDLKRFYPDVEPRYLRKRCEIPEDARVVFSPRLMWPLYNIERIAETAHLVCSSDPRVFFLFAVPEPREEAYEQRVRELLNAGAAANRYRFVEAIPHSKMADYYRLADVTISIPSTDGTPMSVLESVACGTPVVVSDLPHYDPEYIESGRTVLVARADDPQSIARSLLRLLNDPALVEEMTTEAQRRVEATGSYEAQMHRMELLYLSLLESNSDRPGFAAPKESSEAVH